MCITYTAARNETIRFRAVDKAGNVSSESTTIVKIDLTNPTAKITATSNQGNITISASGSSDTGSGIKNYQYSRDNKTWYTSTSNSYTFTGLADGTYTVYVKVTDNSGRSSVASTNVTVKNYVYLYDYGTTNTSLVGNWRTVSGTSLMQGWSGSGVRTDNNDNIQLSISGFSYYSNTSSRNRAIGIRSDNRVDLTNYNTMCMVYDLNIPAYSYSSSGAGATGIRLALASSSPYVNNQTADVGYWTTNGNSYNLSKGTMCSNISSISRSLYIFIHIDAEMTAYGATPNAKIYQIYLIPN